jgi:hypothetical protein
VKLHGHGSTAGQSVPIAATRLSHSQATISRDGSMPQAFNASSGAIAVFSAGLAFSYACIHPVRTSRIDPGLMVPACAASAFRRSSRLYLSSVSGSSGRPDSCRYLNASMSTPRPTTLSAHLWMPSLPWGPSFKSSSRTPL